MFEFELTFSNFSESGSSKSLGLLWNFTGQGTCSNGTDRVLLKDKNFRTILGQFQDNFETILGQFHTQSSDAVRTSFWHFLTFCSKHEFLVSARISMDFDLNLGSNSLKSWHFYSFSGLQFSAAATHSFVSAPISINFWVWVFADFTGCQKQVILV